MGKAPLYVRPLTDAERAALEAALRSPDAFVLRRAQILLASARGEPVGAIAVTVGSSGQAVRQVIHAFHRQGLAVLQPRPRVPHTLYYCFDTPAAAYEQGLTAWRVSDETVRATVARMGVRWQRAKQWITSPDPEYARKKARRDRLIRLIRLAERTEDLLLGYLDEVWWSRLARPTLFAWQDPAQPLRLVEQTVAATDPDPKALACYGLLARSWQPDGRHTEALWLRFVDGRPVSAVTIDFLSWCAAQAAALGKRAVLLVWDNASWHESQKVRTWLRQHNRPGKQAGHGVRLIACFLPVKSPWLNPIEPKWLSGKKRVVEPARLLSAAELEERVCATYDCPHYPHYPHYPHLVQPAPTKRTTAISKKAA